MVKFEKEDRSDWRKFRMGKKQHLKNLNWFANSTQSTTSIDFINPVLVTQKQ